MTTHNYKAFFPQKLVRDQNQSGTFAIVNPPPKPKVYAARKLVSSFSGLPKKCHRTRGAHAFNHVEKAWEAPPLELLISPRNKVAMHDRIKSATVRSNDTHGHHKEFHYQMQQEMVQQALETSKNVRAGWAKANVVACEFNSTRRLHYRKDGRL